MLPICFSMIDPQEDEKTFEALYYRYKDRIYAISLDILKDKQLAEDSTVEAFISLAKNFQIIKELEHHKLDYYIVITSRNTAIDMLKKEKENMRNIPYSDDAMLINENISGYDTDFLKECIKQLSYTDREILYLRFSYGLDYKHIAKTLGISAGAARKRVQYAKDRLKKLLEKEDICI